MKRVIWIVVVLAVLLAAGGYAYWQRGEEAGSGGGLRVSGNIEVTETRLSFKIPGRLAERPVDEGEAVTAGQLVARLEDIDQRLRVGEAEANLAYAEAVVAELESGSRPQEIEGAKAAVAQAQAQLDELLAGSREEEIAAARAQVQQAQAEASRLEEELARSVLLMKEDVGTPELTERARTAAKVARENLESARQQLQLVEKGPRSERIDQAREALRQAQERQALVIEGPRKESIDQAHAKRDLARQALLQARQQLEYTLLHSPGDGVALSKSAEPGEYLNPGSAVLTVGGLQDPWLRAYVSEKNLGRVQLGASADITTDAFPGRAFQGRVSFISGEAEFTPKTVQTFEERVKLMYRIKIETENPDQALKPGMPADAVIHLDP